MRGGFSSTGRRVPLHKQALNCQSVRTYVRIFNSCTQVYKIDQQNFIKFLIKTATLVKNFAPTTETNSKNDLKFNNRVKGHYKGVIVSYIARRGYNYIYFGPPQCCNRKNHNY